jgi:hypothetical protein
MSDDNFGHASRQPEHHESQFRYFVIPAGVVELVADGTITRNEAWLLALIDSLVKVKGEGCWASNQWLGERCGVKKRQVQLDISHLRELGLIVDSIQPKLIRGEPTRTIEAYWSRSGEFRPPAQSNALPPMQDLTPPHVESDTQVDTERKERPPPGGVGEKESLANARSSSPHTRVASLKTNGALASIKTDESSLRFARRLHQLITSKLRKSISYKESSWVKEFDRLRASLDGNEHLIDEALGWYEKEWDQIRVKAYCAETFRNRFNKFLELKDNLIHNNNPKGAPGQSHSQRQKGVGCSNKRLTIPDDVREQLDEIEWRQGEPDGLEQFYLETLDAADRLITVGRSVDEDTEEGAAMDNFIYAMGGSPKVMAMRWCRWAAASANGWKGWGGSLKPFRLHPDSNLFKDRLKAACGNVKSGTVSRLIATLKREWA